MNPVTPSLGLAKRAQIDAGLRRLCSSRRPGQLFTQREIAQSISEHEVKICHRTIQIIECKALRKVARALSRVVPEILNDAYGADKVREVLGTLSTETHSPARVKRSEVRSRAQPATPSRGLLYSTADILASRRRASENREDSAAKRDFDLD